MKEVSMALLSYFGTENVVAVSIQQPYTNWDTIVVRENGKLYSIEIHSAEEEGK